MKKVYIFTGGSIPEDWTDAYNDLVNVDPDLIVIVSNTEVYLEGNWGSLLDKLQPWLASNNKIANIITPHLDNVWIRPNVLAERSYGMIESVLPLYKNQNYEPLTFDKVYCSYMFRPSESRGRLLDSLISKNLLDDGYITYHFPNVKTHPEFEYFNKPPIVFDDEQYTKNSVDHFINPYLYRNSFIDIVTEASHETDLFFLTEKTIRAICHEKPFITVGSKGFHKKYLKEYFGFELYNEIIDYSFDDHSSIQYRINGIIENLKRIISNKDKLEEYYEILIPKLKHNRQVLHDIYNDTSKVIPKSLQPLLTCDYSLHGFHRSSLMHLIEQRKG